MFDPTDLRADATAAANDLDAWHARTVRLWSDGAPGWAPEVATELLTRSRLDRQAALCRCLRAWLDPPPRERADGSLILAWVNLGSLVEGALQFFLSVYAHDYANNPVRRKRNAMDVQELMFQQLQEFFRDAVWTDEQRQRWDPWLETVRLRRNAIHAYEDRDIGTHDDFLRAVVTYRELAHELEGQLPEWPSIG